MNQPQNTPKRKFEYKWAILAVSFMMVFVTLGFCSSNKGLYLGAITEALNIPRSLFSINDSCRFITSAITNLFFAALIKKFGVRQMVGAGFLALIASMLLYATASNVLVFYVGGILLGAGLTFTSNSIASYLIKHWFSGNIGRYLGLVFAANGIGGALAAQIITPIIYNGEAFGYRKSYLMVAGILLVVGIISVSILREPPAHLAVTPSPKKKARGVAWSGIAVNELKRKPWFYFVCLMVFFTGFVLQGVSGAWVAHVKDVGFDAEFVATAASVSSLVLTVSKIAVGLCYDRFGLRPTLLICEIATVAAFTMMAVLTVSTTGMVLTFCFAVFYSLALPLETVVIPLIVNDLFGTRSFDQCLGYLLAFNYAGYACGTPIVNLCYDISGSYSTVFAVFGALMLVLAIAFYFTVGVSYKTKKKIMEADNAVQEGA